MFSARRRSAQTVRSKRKGGTGFTIIVAQLIQPFELFLTPMEAIVPRFAGHRINLDQLNPFALEAIVRPKADTPSSSAQCLLHNPDRETLSSTKQFFNGITVQKLSQRGKRMTLDP